MNSPKHACNCNLTPFTMSPTSYILQYYRKEESKQDKADDLVLLYAVCNIVGRRRSLSEHRLSFRCLLKDHIQRIVRHTTCFQNSPKRLLCLNSVESLNEVMDTTKSSRRFSRIFSVTSTKGKDHVNSAILDRCHLRRI